MGSRGKVIVGMSGGVDSAVTAYLLKEEGFEVVGVKLGTVNHGETGKRELEDAEQSAKRLGIAFITMDFSELFRERVMLPFATEYVRGRTPNPCIECNRYVKWEGLIRAAEEMKADCVATGHYAVITRLANGRYTVGQAADKGKDQSYMLCKLSQEQLARTLLPLGKLTKNEVRRIAGEAGLPVANKADSQEICFVSNGSYVDSIESDLNISVPEAGDFVDEEGNILGRHRGIVHYTVGQRKGLGLALGFPAYVKCVDFASNRVVVGPEESLYTSAVFCDDLNFMSVEAMSPGEGFFADVKIRYRHAGESAFVEPVGEDLVKLRFEHPVRAPAPGQSAVFYDKGGYIIGAGKIRQGYGGNGNEIHD